MLLQKLQISHTHSQSVSHKRQEHYVRNSPSRTPARVRRVVQGGAGPGGGGGGRGARRPGAAAGGGGQSGGRPGEVLGEGGTIVV